MDSLTHQCPLCAEDIPRTATICPYCNAEFTVTTQGYCQICHQVSAADVNGLCTQCATVLVDLHTHSQLIQPEATSAQQPKIPPSGTRSAPEFSPDRRVTPESTPARPAQRKKLWLWILSIGMILYATYVLIPKENLPAILSPGTSSSSATPHPSSTPQPIATQEPTYTPWPSFTPTPPPVEVSFDTIGDYDTGRLVILVGRLVLTSNIKCRNNECGLLIENPAEASQKLVIFIRAGDDPNQLKPVPETYSKGDIKVRLDDGTYALVGYRLRITGSVCKTTDGDPCIDAIRKVELYQVK